MNNLSAFIGILSLLQMGFIPGFLLLNSFKLEIGILRTFLLSFALSLPINYVTVALLTCMGWYTSSVTWTLLSVEFTVFLYLLWRNGAHWQSVLPQKSAMQEFWVSLSDWQKGLFCLSLFVIAQFIYRFFAEFGQIFQQWDPVMSYNFWAEQWAANHFPIDTWHYPQQMMANWSLSYVMLQPFSASVNLQLFAKALMDWFEPILLLVFLDLAISFKQTAYLLAIVLTAYLLHIVLGQYLGAGWMDIPVATLSMIACYSLILASQYINAQPKQAFKYIFISAIVVGGAASTKQAGIYLALWYPVLVYFLALRGASITSSKRLVIVLASSLLMLAICLPWYLYIEWLILHGTAGSEISFVTQGIYQAQNIAGFKRIVVAFYMTGLSYWILFAFALHAVFKGNSSWRLLAVMGAVYSMVWLCLYSYDSRNIALSIPFIAGSAAFAIQSLHTGTSMRYWREKLSSVQPFWLCIGSVLIIAILATQLFNLKSMRDSQIEQQKNLGDPTLNWVLLQYLNHPGLSGKILTSWDYLGHVPVLSKYYLPYQPTGSQSGNYQSAWMVHPEELSSVLQATSAKYILSTNSWGLVSPAYQHYFQQLTAQHQLKVLIALPQFTLYEIISPVVAK